MTRVDFYILPEAAPTGDGGLVMTTCRLCDKATAAGQRLYVHADEAALLDSLNSALWSFRQGSFIAHETYDGTALEAPLPEVLLGAIEPPDSHHDVLINLAREVPPFFSRFTRVLEIVGGDAAQRTQSRARFKYYRERGYELSTHNL